MSDDSATRLVGFPRSERYEVLERIGEGGMGLVFRARDRTNGLPVALKTMRRPGGDDLFRLKREFRELADILHPNLAQLYELEAGDQGSFFTMELIEGVSFLEYARPEGAGCDFERSRGALAQLALGLRALHQRGKLHRDIKPMNVMVEPTGRVVLLDFGLATAIGPAGEPSRATAIAGTLSYMAPEVAWGAPPTPASDWYSVGVLLFECLTGSLPFAGATLADLNARRDRPPPSPREWEPSVPEDLDALTRALLDADPDQRAGATDIRRVAAVGGSDGSELAEPVGGATPFVGRERERAVLERAFADARAGTAVTVRVEGPSGIGKTALIRHFANAAREETGALILASRCHPQATIRFEALDGIVDELSRYLLELSPQRLDALAPRNLRSLRRIFPVLGRVPFVERGSDPELGDAEPTEIRRRAFAALRELLARLADRQPLVLWADDLQWGEADSASLLRELLRGPDPPAALFVLSYRSEDRDESELVQGLLTLEGEGVLGAEAGSVRELALAALDPEESQRLLAAAFGEEHAALLPLAEPLATEAGGSPFVLGELARTFIQRNQQDSDSSGEIVLGDVVRGRVRRLPSAAARLLQVVSLNVGPLERRQAVRAAGIDGDPRALLAELHQEQLLRTTRTQGRSALETYHDRIRETVTGDLAEPARRGLHAELLEVLTDFGDASPASLFRHAEGAGETRLAADHAVAAGDAADTALAFAQAARFYGRALELRDWSALDRRALRVKRAGALVNAGRGGDAAPVYLEAAEGAAREENLEYRRLAAEQYLVSGRTDEGLEVLEPLLGDLDLKLPATARRALLSTAVKLGQLRLRGIRARSPGELGPEARTRIDVCYSAAKGLILVDTVRAGYLPLVSLQLALRAGEPVRVGRSLAMVGGGVLAPLGGLLARWGARMLDAARDLAEVTDEPYLHAAVALAEGQVGVQTGDWNRAKTRSDDALTILREHCRGVQWEKNASCAALFRAVDEMGDLGDAHHRAEELALESANVGDRYGAVVAALQLGVTGIAQGRPGWAREQLDRAFRRWSQASFQMQHFYGLRIHVMADLYEENPKRASERLHAAWPAIEAAGFLRVPAPRIDALLMRLRIAGALDLSPGARDDARSDARRLERERRLDARAHVLLLSRSPTAEARARAQRLFAAAGMDLMAAVAGGGRMDRWPGVTNPEKLARVFDPYREQCIP